MVFIQIIAPEVGSRHQPLTDALDRLGLEYSFVRAHMLTDIPEGYDMQRAIAYNGWPLTPGEIGCATSHREAYKNLLATGSHWGLVLEDDARILEPEGFSRLLSGGSLPAQAGMPMVISLYVESAIVKARMVGAFWQCLSPPYFAVAYLINAQGCAVLSESNARHSQPADWPVSSTTTFFAATPGMIGHGDTNHASLIGNRLIDGKKQATGRNNLSLETLFHRLSLYTYIHFWRHRGYFSSSTVYFKAILYRRIHSHLTRLLRTLGIDRIVSWALYPEVARKP